MILATAITLSAAINSVDHPEMSIIVPLMGASIAVISGVSGIYKFQDNWTAYRTTAESLKHEKKKLENTLFKERDLYFDSMKEKEDVYEGDKMTDIKKLTDRINDRINKYPWMIPLLISIGLVIGAIEVTVPVSSVTPVLVTLTIPVDPTVTGTATPPTVAVVVAVPNNAVAGPVPVPAVTIVITIIMMIKMIINKKPKPPTRCTITS